MLAALGGHGFAQNGQADGFGQDSGDALLPHGLQVGGTGVSGADQHGAVAVNLAQHLVGFGSAESGHDHVENHQANRLVMFAKDLDSGVTIGGGDHGVTGGLQQFTQHVADGRFVVDDQDGVALAEEGAELRGVIFG